MATCEPGDMGTHVDKQQEVHIMFDIEVLAESDLIRCLRGPIQEENNIS